MRRYILFSLCLFCASIFLSAQGDIDKIINVLEKKSDVETTYTERRSPKKKKLVMTSRIFNFENKSYFEMLRKSFEEERKNSISAVKTKSQMTYRFDNDKGVSSYTLSWSGTLANPHGPFTMVMTWRSNDASDTSFLPEDPSAIEFTDGDLSMSIEDSYGCKVYNVSARHDDGRTVRQQQVALARQQAAKARQQAAKARQEAAKARAQAQREASKARAQAQREAAKARCEASRAAAKARAEASRARAKAHREAAHARAEARRQSVSVRCENTEKIYDLAARSRCRIINGKGETLEMNALDALDNDMVWQALEQAVDNGSVRVSSTNSGSTTTVIIEPEPEKI